MVYVDNGLPVANLPAEVAALLLASPTVDAATEGPPGGAESFWEDTPHENPNTTMIPDGRRHNGLVTYAGRLRNAGLDRAEAEVLFRARWLLCEQPDGQISEATFHSPSCRFPVTWPEAQAKLRDVYDRYPAGHQDDGGDEQADDGQTVCTLAWPTLSEPAFHGTAGKIVNLVAPHTEADPAAILTQLLAQFGATLGPAPHIVVGNERHPAIIHSLIVGRTKSGAKGTGLAVVEAIGGAHSLVR